MNSLKGNINPRIPWHILDQGCTDRECQVAVASEVLLGHLIILFPQYGRCFV
jgi:hypothetical protein